MSKQTKSAFDEIEARCDANNAQFTLSRASGIWIGMIRMEDGRMAQHQSPKDQDRLIADCLHSLERMEAEQ